jgi:hypothetical protein
MFSNVIFEVAFYSNKTQAGGSAGSRSTAKRDTRGGRFKREGFAKRPVRRANSAARGRKAISLVSVLMAEEQIS